MPVTQQQHWEYTLNEWNTQEFRILLDHIPNVDVFYDIGANVGAVSEVIHKRFPNARIYCWEPDTDNFNYLSQLNFVTAFNSGIYYGKDKAHLMSRGDSNVGGYFIDDVDAGFPEVDTGKIVALSELESFQIPPPTLAKLDVEGSELNILKYSTLLRSTPYLIVEWHLATLSHEYYFHKYLPNHEIKGNASSNYLLCLKSPSSV